MIEIARNRTSVVDLLAARAAETPDRIAYHFVPDEGVAADLTYAELWRRASGLAYWLSSVAQSGDRALLLYPAGLDFVSSFYACLSSGVVAVPAPPPDPARMARYLPRIEAMAEDAGPVAVLTTSAVCAAVDRVRDQSPGLGRLRWIATDALDVAAPETGWQPPALAGDDLAYLQYTSGSTSTPKGVMVTHAALLHNSEHLRTAWGYTPESVAVMWVPNFHDDGLVHGIVQPLYTGYRCVLMQPMAVAQRPVHWLQTITRFRGTHSGGPNFAYALCVRKVTPEQRAELDLGSWTVAYNAAEPIRRETLTRFHEAFGSCGFRWEAFYPSFGLAESTLLVTTRRRSQAPAFCTLDASALELRHRVMEVPPGAGGGRVIVGCGHPPEEGEIAIVEPETRRPCAPGEVGEVWISSLSVASGYWNRPEESERTFGARLADGKGPFLRTGDLGFLRDGELFVTGRLKDLIILHGRNIYPQDVELTAEKSHPALRAGCGAAFSVEAGGEERLVVVHEVNPGLDADLDRIVDGIRQAVAEEHELPLHAVVLLRPRTLAKTSSGKVQRQSCRRAYLAGSLETVRQWTARVAEPVAGAGRRRVDELIAWLRGPGAERINSRLMDERRSIPPHVVLELGNRGAFGLLVPEAYGGLGLGYGDAVRVFEQLAAIDLTLASFVSGHNSLGVLPILRHGREELRRELLPRLASGRELAAFALTEPEAGSNPRAMTSRAEADGHGGWRLYGTKVWSGTAAWAGAINVFVQHPEYAQAGGVSGFVLRPPSPGLRLGPEALTLGLRGMVQSPVLLEGVAADEGSMLGRPGEGMEAAQDAMMSARLLLAAIAVGGMKRCAQLMLRYASRRAISTGSLLENPVSLARISSLTAAISALESLVRRTAELLDAGGAVPVDALLCCKIAGSELLWQAADDLVQLLGGRGYVEANVAPQILRDARILRIVEGPTETLRMFLGTRAWYEGGELHELLTSALEAPEVSARLRETLQAVNARCTGSRSPFAHRPSGLRWAYALGGEITVAAVLWAAAKARPGTAAEWARASFEQTVARCLAASAEETGLLSAGEIRSEVAAYEGDIGDVEPSAPDEDRELDPLLRRSVALAAPATRPAAVPERPAAGPLRGAESISAWLCERIARQIGVAVEEIDPRKPFAYQGLDSVTSVMLLQELGEWLRKPLSPTLAWAHPTIDLLSRHLAVEHFPSVSVKE